MRTILTKKIIEGKSWAIPLEKKYAYLNNKVIKLAEIYFATDEDIIKEDDKKQLDIIKKSIRKINSKKFKIKRINIIGAADYRASDKYNIKLGNRRASAVKRYLSNLNLTINSSSIGETNAIQPSMRVNPSLEKIMKDRKVVVTVNTNDIIPPVAIALDYSGTDLNKNYLSAVISVYEINNKGNIVSSYKEPGSIDAPLERKDRNIKDDPILPTVFIKVKVIRIKYNNQYECIVICKAIHTITGNELFSAFADTVDIKPIKAYDYQNKLSGGGKGRVWRTERLLGNILPNSVIRKILLTSCSDRIELLFDSIYSQLKGSYKNITKRAEAILSNQYYN